METDTNKNTEELKKLTQELAKRRSEEKKRKIDDPSSLRQYAFRETLGKIDPMRFLPPQVRALVGVGKDIGDIFKAKRVRATMGAGTIDTESVSSESIIERIETKTEKEEKQTGEGFSELINQNVIMTGVMEELLSSSEGIQRDISGLLREMLFQRQNDLEDRRERSRMRSRFGRGSAGGGRSGGPGGAGDDGEGSLVDTIIDKLLEYGGYALGGGGLAAAGASRLTRGGTPRTPGSPRTPRDIRNRARNINRIRNARIRGPRRLPRIPGGGGRFGALAGGTIAGLSLYDMLMGDSTESYMSETGVELNPYAGGLDPNLIGLAYGGEMLASSTGMLNMGPNVQAPTRVANALTRARTAASGSRLVQSGRNIMNASRGVQAARTAMTAIQASRAAGMAASGAAALGGAGTSLLGLAGGPVGLPLLVASTVGTEYLARLTESNVGKSISLAGGTRRQGNQITDSYGNVMETLTDTEGLQGAELANANKENAIKTSVTKLVTNSSEIEENAVSAKQAYDDNDDDIGRMHMEAIKDLLKVRVRLAADTAGVLGVRAGTEEADSLLSLDTGGISPGRESRVRSMLQQMESELSFFEFVDSGKMTDVLDLMSQTSTTATSDTNASFNDIQQRRSRNFNQALNASMQNVSPPNVSPEGSMTTETPVVGVTPPRNTQITRGGDTVTQITNNMNSTPQRTQDPRATGVLVPGFDQ